jgi:transposase
MSALTILNVSFRSGVNLPFHQLGESSVGLVKQGEKPMAEIERDLGLPKGIVKQWVRKAQAEGEAAFPGKGNLSAADAEMKRLQRENEILRQERDILKKAIAIFSQAQNRSISS